MDQEESQVVQKVTKPKNQGRVEAGKKLAEWNRQNKAKLKQGPGKEPAQVETSEKQVFSSESSSTSTSTSASTSEVVKSSHFLLFLVGIGTFLGVAYVFRQKRSAPKPAEKAESTTVKAVFDPFGG